MSLIEKLADARIVEAYERGELDNLPGAGAPLALGDDVHVPEELRAPYRMLKNAGYLPPEIELRREIADVEQLLALSSDSELRRSASRRLSYLMIHLSMRGARRDLRADDAYYRKLIDRLGAHHSP